MIQLVDLKSQYHGIREEMLAAIEEIIESTAFIQGKYVADFEAEFCRRHGLAHGAACSNGTAALFLALVGAGVGPGDEVITTTNTFVATGEAICHVGAKPVFVDIDPKSYLLDIAKAEAAVTPRTKAIIPVHLYGNAQDMDACLVLAKRHGLKVIEDCAQAHFARYKGRFIGTFGEAASFSFYPGKNLGAYGDAGFVTCADKAANEHVRRLIDHGRSEKYLHDVIGYNHRMDAMQAAILSVKLRHIDEWTRRRRAIAQRYDERLKAAGFQVLEPTPGAEAVYHIYPVQVSNRDAALAELKKRGIGAAIHYPVPLHLQPAFGYLGYKRGDMPVSEAFAQRELSLPIFGELPEADVETVIAEFLKVAHA